MFANVNGHPHIECAFNLELMPALARTFRVQLVMPTDKMDVTTDSAAFFKQFFSLQINLLIYIVD